MVKNEKRRVKRDEVDKKEVDRLQGVEDALEAAIDVAERAIEAVSKVMTLKRLELDEAKYLGETP